MVVENGATKWKSGVRATSLTRNMEQKGIGKGNKHYQSTRKKINKNALFCLQCDDCEIYKNVH